MTNQFLKLEEQICFSLYAATREMTKRYRPLLEELQVTYPQYLVLLVLWETDNISVKALGKRLFLDSGTLTPMLKRMEENGLIKRTRLPEDERVVQVTLTTAGRAAKEKATCIPGQILEHIDLEAEELAQLKQTLAKISRQMDKRSGEQA